MTERIGGWTQTFSGKQFWGKDARREDLDIESIAHALALVNRYNGHTPYPYSVAQHSVLVSRECDPADAFWGLMHDASEAYIGDMISPIKRFNHIYLEDETRLMKVVCERFGMAEEMPASVKKADLTVLAAEADVLFPVRPADWKLPFPAAKNCPIKEMAWWEAEEQFLARFYELEAARINAQVNALEVAGYPVAPVALTNVVLK